MVTGELRQLLDHDRASRHVDADRERLGREHDLDQAGDETRLDDLLHRRHHAGVVRSDPGFELAHESVEAEHLEVVGVEPGQPLVDDRSDLGPLRIGS